MRVVRSERLHIVDSKGLSSWKVALVETLLYSFIFEM